MIAYVLAFTLCHVTVPSSDPVKDPKFTQCQLTEKVFTVKDPKDMMSRLVARMACTNAMKKGFHAANDPVMAAIRKATKFPYTSKQKIVKSGKCRLSKLQVS